MKLMERFSKDSKDPDEACLKWNVRYNGAFRQLLSDASFLQLANQVPLRPGEGEAPDELLSQIQDRLERHIEANPHLVESEGQIENEIAKYIVKDDAQNEEDREGKEGRNAA